MTTADYKKIEAYMLECMQDSAHDREHVYRVLYTALFIAESEQAVDFDVLLAACLLHDIGRLEQNQNPALDHAEVGGEVAPVFAHDGDQPLAQLPRKLLQLSQVVIFDLVCQHGVTLAFLICSP